LKKSAYIAGMREVVGEEKGNRTIKKTEQTGK